MMTTEELNELNNLLKKLRIRWCAPWVFEAIIARLSWRKCQDIAQQTLAKLGEKDK